MGKIVKTLLAIVFLAALAALVFWMVKIKQQPWWLAAAVVAGICGLLAGFVFFKRYLVRGRERKFVQRVIDQDTEAIERASVSRRHELIELQENWKESIRRLQNSHLRRHGNPLYVLPWFLIMGESKAGKTSAVKNAGQSTPMTEISRSAGISGTRNCDWWFFDRAVILDTAGRYTIPVDEGPDLEEWKQFLLLLSKYRKKEPLNGVVVAISADKLAKADAAGLKDEGQSIRRRIDQMMRTMGARFPVYVLITKMDLIHGFCQFNQSLPDHAVAQAMGYTNTSLKVYWRDVLQDAAGSITANLRSLRFLLAHGSSDPEPGALLFPTEFQRMLPGLAMFLEAVFEENPYQETPLLRGIYFSSALRKDQPLSEFLEITGIRPRPPADPVADQGMFLKDFFAAILPADRRLFTPLREFLTWRRATRSLGLLSWALIGLAFCGLLGASYYHNHSIIKIFSRNFYDPPVLSGNYGTDLLMLDKMRLNIEQMDQAESSWVLPGFGLNHGRRMIDKLKKHYVRLFREGFLAPIDRNLMTKIEKRGKIKDDDFVAYAGYVISRLWVLEKYLQGEKLPPENDFRLIASNLLADAGINIIPEISQKMGDIYLAYLEWNHDKIAVKAKVGELQVALLDLIRKRGHDLRWLVHGWIPETAAVVPADFAPGTDAGAFASRPKVPGAFTESGRRHIERFLGYMQSTLSGVDSRGKKGDGRDYAKILEQGKAGFWKWYRREFYRRWRYFVARFPKALYAVRDNSTRQQLALAMTGEQNPYFLLLQKVADEVKSLEDERGRPLFFKRILKIEKIRQLAATEQKKKKSLGAKISDKAIRFEKSFDQKTDEKKAQQLEKDLVLAHAWNDYVKALSGIKIDLTATDWGYDAYKTAFAARKTKQAAAVSSALPEANSTFAKLETMARSKNDFPALWALVSGPRDYLVVYAAGQAGCFVQRQWQEQVLSYIESIDQTKIALMLFDKQDGLVWKFVNEIAGPFLTRNKSGFAARRDIIGGRLAFERNFFHFLNKGQAADIDYQPEYKVDLTAVDMEVNPGIQVEPYESILKVNCADRSLVLENFNYPRKVTFDWSPEKCGDTVLIIKFQGFELLKRYTGRLGFAKFLQDFRYGSHVFPAKAFAQKKSQLKRAGVKYIKISYKISGARPVIRLLEKEPTSVPVKIVRCSLEK